MSDPVWIRQMSWNILLRPLEAVLPFILWAMASILYIWALRLNRVESKQLNSWERTADFAFPVTKWNMIGPKRECRSLYRAHKGSFINHVVKILDTFDPFHPLWTFLSNKAYVIRWSFAFKCPRGLWMSHNAEVTRSYEVMLHENRIEFMVTFIE